MPVSLHDLQKQTQKKPANKEGKGFSIQKALSYEIGGKKLSDSFKESFYGEMALLLEAGMNIKSALDLMGEQKKKEKHKKLLADIVYQLTRGGRFSEVLRDQGRFSAYEHFSVKIGEETGNLGEVLKRLSTYYGNKIQQRRALIGALTYPGIIMITALLAVTFMLTYMVPLFKDIFLRMGGQLPALTQMIINLSEGFGTLLLLGGLLIGGLLLVHFLYRQREGYKKIFYGIVLRIPIAGSMLLKTHTLNMVQSMSLLVSSRVPLTEALELSHRMVRFYPISSSMEKIRAMILQGSSLNEGLAKFSIYPARLVTLVKVGEESNQLELIFKKLGVQMEEELQHRAKMLGNALEPLIIIFLGFLVALILVAMYLPMFQLSTSFGF